MSYLSFFDEEPDSLAEPAEPEDDPSSSSSDEAAHEVTLFPMEGFEDEPTLSPEERRERKKFKLRNSPSKPVVEDINTPVFAQYAYSEKDYAEMRPKLALFARHQLAVDLRDGPFFAPLLRNNMLEHLPAEDGSVALIQLGRQLTTTAQSVVFEIVGRPDLVLKYQADCDREGPVHPLLRDALFLDVLTDTKLVPSVYYVSPPAPMRVSVDKKTNFLMTATERAKCVKQNRSVRFLIMDRFDQNLYDYVNARGTSLIGAVSVMKVLLEGLRRMHVMGIVHGDVHPGNIGLIGDKAVFIDFGLAFHIEEKIGTPEKIGDRLGYVHCLFSHWDLEGYRFSFRDDAYKVIMIGAYLIQGRPFMDHIQQLEKDGEAMLRFKRDAFLFEVPGSPKIAASLKIGEDKKMQIQQLLQQVLDSVRSVHDINDLPDYDMLIGLLDSILALVNP